uniref:Nuclear protein MDM1 n=1 Tax=Stomoxys calcitrans TaxID=35570 RepID=A0A1I8PUI7_STOCA
MIGSFWNLCRACPSMPVDKLHSEYRSTYRWHEFTGNSRPEVVRRAPAPNPNQFVGTTNEPPLPRRKKCPELAYKSHEFIIGSEYTDARYNAANRMPRSEERNGTPSRRSKSEGPPAVPNGRAFAIPTEVDGPETKQAGESNGLFKKTISKLSTEYRLQFVWPNVRRIRDQSGSSVQKTTSTTATAKEQQQFQPKKSISLGAIRGQHGYQQHHPLHQQDRSMLAAMPSVHKKRTTNQKEATLHELEPLVSDAEDRKPIEKQVTIQERKVTARPFSQLIDQERPNHFITKKENFGFEDITDGDNKRQHAKQEQQGEIIMNGSAPPHSKPNLDLWFKEVVELRKKAGEYKSRGWGTEIDPELYNKQKDLWDQVSKRSSLSSLCLASTMPRPITKEEKDQENNKKTTPVLKPQKPRVPGQAYILDNKDELNALPARFSHIRHHLERTTGPDVEEGALLPSPTREKLMPAITKRESESQRGSPKKTAASRHGSPQKGSPQKGSPKKILKTRSQSVGPENESPKRQIRSASTAPTSRTAGKKTPTAATGSASIAERKARPSTLSTTLHNRTKSSSLPPPSGRAHANAAATTASAAVAATNANNQLHLSTSQQSSKSPSQPAQMRKSEKDKSNAAKPCSKSSSKSPHCTDMTSSKLSPPSPRLVNGHGHGHGHDHGTGTGTGIGSGGIIGGGVGVGKPNLLALNHLAVPGRDKKLAENEGEDGRDTAISVSSCSPQPAADIPEEPIVKSPPEPTRVKSPEQIIMRSPDPVNWTVPLDTGKTFTVTQNVKEGENYSRPQSEIKASTPVEKPPPPPQSAPPELTEQVKMDAAWKKKQPSTNSEVKSPQGTLSPTSTGEKYPTAASKKPLPGSSIRVLEDPLFDVDVVMASSAAAAAAGAAGANLSSSSNSTTTTASTARSTATEVLEKARDRFDRFWGGNVTKEESV